MLREVAVDLVVVIVGVDVSIGVVRTRASGSRWAFGEQGTRIERRRWRM
jgi:hypothetical protein